MVPRNINSSLVNITHTYIAVTTTISFYYSQIMKGIFKYEDYLDGGPERVKKSVNKDSLHIVLD
jgi:hypothetical protein